MRQRTMLLNAIRGHLAEFGIIAAQGPRNVMGLIGRLRDNEEIDLPDIARSALLALAAQLDAMGGELRIIEHRLLAWHRDQPEAPDHPRRWHHHCHRAGSQRDRSNSVPFRPTVCSLPRAGAATELIWGQGASRADLEDGGWLPAKAAGGWGHFGYPPGRLQYIGYRSLGAFAA
jgi:hypothetical protein